MEAFDALLRETVVVTAILALPLLALAAAVGTVVAAMQAATQVQEQTLTLLPKFLVVGCALAACGPFGFHLCVQLFDDVIARIPMLANGT